MAVLTFSQSLFLLEEEKMKYVICTYCVMFVIAKAIIFKPGARQPVASAHLVS